jgi:hypothetical protein
MKEYVFEFELTDEQSMIFDLDYRIYSIKYTEDKKIGSKSITLYYLPSFVSKNSEKRIYTSELFMNNENNDQFYYIYNLIKPFIREHKINNLLKK